jgi:phosphoribosylaminoimidazole carboxylase PurE protein
VILLGSEADLERGRRIAALLKAGFGVESRLRIASAHKTPRELLELLERFEADPAPKVYLTVAGRSNALSGMVDAQVSAPVVATPPYSEAFAGADVFSSLRMPSGVAPAVVLEAEGAALAAAKMLALVDPEVKNRVLAYQEAARERVRAADRALLQGEGE